MRVVCYELLLWVVYIVRLQILFSKLLVCCSSSIILQIFVVWVSFKALNEWRLILVLVGWKSIWIWIPKWMKKIKFFSHFQILGNETLITTGYKDKKFLCFTVVKLWLKEDRDLYTNNLWFSSKFIHSFESAESANIPQNSAFFEP